MIKRILVALDPDSDTPVAIRYAVDIAERSDAIVTGLAVVDMGGIEASGKGGGIGSFYYAEKVKEKLTTETRAKARELLDKFESLMSATNVKHVDLVEEGVPFQRIVEDMKYQDLLVIGKDPHFFYGHPEQKTATLAKVVKSTVAPTLVVGSSYGKVKHVTIAYDGSDASARALRRFAQLKPFGTKLRVDVVNVFQKDEREALLLVKLAADYLGVHGFKVRTTTVKGSHPDKEITAFATETNTDMLIIGAHSVSAVKRLAFGSTTANLLKLTRLPFIVDN